jgi:hypothetical protein
MTSTPRVKKHRFRKKYDLVPVDFPRSDISMLTDILLSMQKLDKDLVSYLKQQKKVTK